MPRPLILSLDGEEFGVSIKKIDRESLYGKVEIEAFDEKNNPAEIKVLAADGCTLIDKGGTALETLDQNGNSIERSQIKNVDKEGKELKVIPSSFDGPNTVSRADIDSYLSLIVKSVYALEPSDIGDLATLKDQLSDGRIYSFPFSYRSGIEPDEAYLISNSADDIFMIVGYQATLQFLKLNQATNLDESEEEEVSGDDISFDLL